MAEALSRQLEDILSIYCRESLSEDGSTVPNGQSHGPVLNGLTSERGGGGKPEGKVNAAGNGGEKEQKKPQDKKKVKGLGKEKHTSRLRTHPCTTLQFRNFRNIIC